MPMEEHLSQTGEPTSTSESSSSAMGDGGSENKEALCYQLNRSKAA